MGSPSFECRFGSLEEGIAEWGSEVVTEWDREAKEGEDSPCSDLHNEDDKQYAMLIRCAKEKDSAMPTELLIFPSPQLCSGLGSE